MGPNSRSAPPGACPLTGVGQQGLEGGLHALVGQELFRGFVPQEHPQHGLRLVAVSRVGVPRDTEAQQGLCGAQGQSDLPPACPAPLGH